MRRSFVFFIRLLFIISMLGCGESNAPMPEITPPSGNATTISAGWGSTLAVGNDGTLWAFGIPRALHESELETFYERLNELIEPLPITIMDSVVSASAGLSQFMVIKNDGSLWAWGRNNIVKCA